MRTKVVVACAVLATWVDAAGAAQDPPPTPPGDKQNPIAAILAKTSLTDEDRIVLRTFITEHVNDIVNGVPDASQKVAELRLPSDPGRATPAAREAYASICIETIAGAYKAARLERAAQLVALLGSLGETPAYRVFIEAIGDARPAVRTAGAAGLRGLRAKLAQAGGAFYTESIEALRAAGKKETSTVGLRTIYQALNYPEVLPSVPDAKLLTSAVLDILETRSEQYASGSVKGAGADHLGLALAASLKASLTDADRERLILIAGRMMLYGVQRYVTELVDVLDKSGNMALIEARNQTEYLIDECERMLLDILKPANPPNLTRAMREAEKEKGDRKFGMRRAMNAWGEILRAKTGQKFELDESSDSGG